MAITGYEVAVVQGDLVTVSLLVWRRYRRPAPGIVEHMLDVNPELARVHAASPFIPPGTQVIIPIDPDIMNSEPRVGPTVMLYGRTET